MFCNNCGNKLIEGVKYCDNCGTLNKVTAEGGHSVEVNTLQKIIKENKITSGIIMVLSVAGLFFIVSIMVPNFRKIFAPTAGQLPDQSIASTTPALQQTSTVLSLLAMSPTTIMAPYSNLISLSGSGFEPGVQVKLGGENMSISGDVTSGLVYVKYQGDFNPGTYSFTVINPDGQKATLNQALTIKSSGAGQTTSLELPSSQITAKISPSIVIVRTDLGCGSGMVVASNGTILTDDHVISGAGYINVYLNSGVSYPATVTSENTNQDLALIKINETNLPTVNFGDSSDASIDLGESVIALGYPLTCNQDQTLEVDPGIVTARRTSAGFGELIQTSARINPGDSGGPLVDESGNVVGINEGIITVLNIDLNITGVAFAIPSATIKSFIAQPMGCVDATRAR